MFVRGVGAAVPVTDAGADDRDIAERFGKGIHNTLEAAAFGLPVIFGPKYQKFQEAVDLVATQAAYPVRDYASLDAILSSLLDDQLLLNTSGESARKLVLDNLGATEQILDLTLI